MEQKTKRNLKAKRPHPEPSVAEENESEEEVKMPLKQAKAAKIGKAKEKSAKPKKDEGKNKEEDLVSSAKLFSELGISDKTMKGIEEIGYKKMTEVQAKAIPYMIKGKDIIVSAKAGTGKTLAFLVPAVELLLKAHFKAKKGTGVLVVCPTREVALQNYRVAQELLKNHDITSGLITGGVDQKAEAAKLKKGVNLLVCTPGRLLDHMQSTEVFYIAYRIGIHLPECAHADH